MSSAKRKLPVRSVSFENNDQEAPPAIAALFLVQFDPKVGYTITWQRSLPGIHLEGVVEYKSLPSGLHHVKEDLIYFTHQKYAGLSAFRNNPSAAAGDRNATFISVGILLRHRRGRIGRGWLHTRALKELAQDFFSASEHTDSLESYWEAHKEKATHEKNSDSNGSAEQNLSIETSRPDLSLSHPILSVEQFLEEFGPLIFPIYRAALLRRKILFIKKPPLCEVCHYVYVLSLISSIPPILVETLSNIKPRRSRSLFSIVIHDLDNLMRPDPEPEPEPGPYEDDCEDEDEYGGWIACTSDEILATKPEFSDLQIRIPDNPNSTSTSNPPWPSLALSTSETVKATQRDLRRYRVLCQGLSRLEQESSTRYRDDDEAEDEDNTRLLHRGREDLRDIIVPKEDTIIESLPWVAVAYDSFIWWASAGERNLQIEDEHAYDRELVMTSSEVLDSHMTASTSSFNRALPSGGLEVAIVAYFHRMTTIMFEVLCDIMDSQDPSELEMENEEQKEAIVVQRADLVRMGLDEWSKGDREFVIELARLYFNREAIVEGAKVECCGVKIY